MFGFLAKAELPCIRNTRARTANLMRESYAVLFLLNKGRVAVSFVFSVEVSGSSLSFRLSGSAELSSLLRMEILENNSPFFAATWY